MFRGVVVNICFLECCLHSIQGDPQIATILLMSIKTSSYSILTVDKRICVDIYRILLSVSFIIAIDNLFQEKKNFFVNVGKITQIQQNCRKFVIHNIFISMFVFAKQEVYYTF